MPPFVISDFEDHNKQKLLVVLVMLPVGIMHYNTTNMGIADELEVKIIWLHNMTDVMMLLSQFQNGWHSDNINMWKKLALEKAFNQLQEKATDFIWSKVSLQLPFPVQSKFDFKCIYDWDNGFPTFMIHLVEPDRKYEGCMQHKMVHL